MSRGKPESQPLAGGYFPYCQWCRFDGHCELRHNEFLSTESGNGVDNSPYPGHEELVWHLIAFQKGTKRGMCTGRIGRTSSRFFYPLACECGAVIPSLTFSSIFGGPFCGKFQPNEKGEERLRIAQEIARERGVNFSEVEEDLPEPDPNYEAVMMY